MCYVVEEGEDLVAAVQVNAEIDLLRYVFSTLLNYGGPVCSAQRGLDCPVQWPQGFPDPSKHPGWF